MIGVDTSIGFFFEALYRSGAYWRFIGFSQVVAAVLLLLPDHSRWRAAKLLCTVVWAFFVACIVLIPIAAWQRRFGLAALLIGPSPATGCPYPRRLSIARPHPAAASA